MKQTKQRENHRGKQMCTGASRRLYLEKRPHSGRSEAPPPISQHFSCTPPLRTALTFMPTVGTVSTCAPPEGQEARGEQNIR
eukprot:scaffold1720_cov238-Pinguiococcus_pyrenoidosus.AAC.11